MRKTVVLTLALASQIFAGGFFTLQFGNPEASAEARKANAAVVVKAAGCLDPASANLTATAIGSIDGERRTIPLEVVKLSEPGTFAIAQQWPNQGKWVIHIQGRQGKAVVSNALMAAGPEGLDRLHAKIDMKPFAAPEIEAMLR